MKMPFYYFLFFIVPLAAQDAALEHSTTLAATYNPHDSYTTEKDYQILLNIREHISSQFGTKYDGIAIRVSNGAVTIEGAVDNHQDLETITNKAYNVQGVGFVNNNLVIANRGQATDSGNNLIQYLTERDRQIALNIRTQLRLEFGSLYDHLAINVENGVVRISGLVGNISDSNDILRIASHVEGVEHVDNQLDIKQTPSLQFEDNQVVDPRDSFVTVTDRVIVISLRGQLTAVSDMKYDKIYIHVDQGIVTLTGDVPTQTDAAIAVLRATRTQGVQSVNDLLRYGA